MEDGNHRMTEPELASDPAGANASNPFTAGAAHPAIGAALIALGRARNAIRREQDTEQDGDEAPEA